MTTLDNHTRFFGNLCNANDKIDGIEFFHEELELFIESKKAKYQSNDEEIDKSHGHYTDKSYIDDTLAQNLRSAVVVNLVTFIEVELQNLCSDLQKSLNLNVKYNDFKGSILEQFKIYVNKVALLDIDFSKNKFYQVKNIIELRNCIVHHEGQIENFYGRKFTRTESIMSLVKELPEIKIKENDFIFLDAGACEKLILISKEFIDSIYESVLKKFPKNNYR